jgi:hypothetical protein
VCELQSHRSVKSPLLLRRAPERSDVAYENLDKDVWFDDGHLIFDGDRGIVRRLWLIAVYRDVQGSRESVFFRMPTQSRNSYSEHISRGSHDNRLAKLHKRRRLQKR